jgi:hypothetical protein
VVPEPAKLVSVPPENVTSLATKSETGSLIAKVSVAVWPEPRLDLSLEMAIEGGSVSTAIFTVLSGSAPSLLKMPAALENLSLPTLTTPGVVLFAVGVNVAV